MQDGGGGALRGAAAPAGSGASRLRDESAGVPRGCGWEPAAQSPRPALPPEGERRAERMEEGGPTAETPGG